MHSAELTLDDIKSKPLAIVFVLWLLVLPFGEMAISLRVGPVVLYPSLFLGIVICLLGIRSFFKWNNHLLIISIFIGIWLIQGFVQYLLQQKTDLALFDLKVLIYQVITTGALFTTYSQLGKEFFFKLLLNGLRYFLLILVAFAVFEMTTGIHLQGATTDKLINLPVSYLHYAPLFKYDNPNNFIAFYLFVLTWIFLLDKSWGKNVYLMLCFTLFGYFVSEYADSNLGKLSFVLLALFLVSTLLIKIKRIELVFGIIGVVLIGIVLYKQPIFLGPKYENGQNYRINGLIVVKDSLQHLKVISKENLTQAEQQSILNTLDSIEASYPYKSYNVRKSLIENGVFLIQKHPFLGVGPGQFYQLHLDKKVPHDTGTVTSAHCFPIEVTAVYGFIGWIYLFFIVFYFIKIALSKALSYEYYLKFFIAGILLVLIWMMPANFIFLEIHRLTLPLLVITFISLKQKPAHD